MKIKNFTLNLLFSSIVNIAIKLTWFLIIDIKFQNIVGNKEYGVYLTLLNIIYVLSSILDFGVSIYISANIKNIDSNEKQKLISSLIYVKLCLSFVFIILLFLIGSLINYNFEYFYIFILLGITQLFYWLNIFLRSIISGSHHFKAESIFSSLDRGILIIIFLFSILYYKLDLLSYVIFQLLASIINFLLLILYITKILKYKLNINLNQKLDKTILKASFSIFTYTLIMSLILKLDTIILNYFIKSPESVGQYGAVMRLIEAYQNFLIIIPTILIPIFSDSNNINKSKIKNYSLFLIIISGVFLFLMSNFFGEFLLKKLYISYIPEQLVAMKILSLGTIFLGIYIIYNALMIAKQKFFHLNIIVLITLILCLLLNLILSQKYNFIGSAYSYLITFIFISILLILYNDVNFKKK